MISTRKVALLTILIALAIVLSPIYFPVGGSHGSGLMPPSPVRRCSSSESSLSGSV